MFTNSGAVNLVDSLITDWTAYSWECDESGDIGSRNSADRRIAYYSALRAKLVARFRRQAG